MGDHFLWGAQWGHLKKIWAGVSSSLLQSRQRGVPLLLHLGPYPLSPNPIRKDLNKLSTGELSGAL